MQTDVFDSPEVLAAAAGELFVELGHKAIQDHGVFNVLLSGGTTPRAVYRWLAEHGDRLDWANVRLFFGDERCVPPEHPDSNYRMAREAMLDTLDVYGIKVARIPGELPPHDAAARYEAIVRTMFDDIPRFDLIFLGLGADAHTASLFPHTSALHEQERWWVANFADSQRSWRITATPFIINNGAQIAFLVSGDSKADSLQSVLYGERDVDRFPAQVVQPWNGVVRWLVDREAARLLDEETGNN